MIYEQKCEKYNFFYLKLSVFGGEIFNILEQACFCNVTPKVSILNLKMAELELGNKPSV